MEWIKVSQTFPPENTKVLGIYALGCSGVEMITVEWSRERGWSAIGLNYDKPLVVSYWTHVPILPEEWWK